MGGGLPKGRIVEVCNLFVHASLSFLGADCSCIFFIDLSFYRILKIWFTVWCIEFNSRGFGKCATVFAIAICLTPFKSR